MSNNLIRFLFSALLFNLFSISAFALNGNLPGDGTEDNPYLIEDSIDMLEFANSANAAKYWSIGVYSSLAANIDMSSYSDTFTSALVAGCYLDEVPATHVRQIPIFEDTSNTSDSGGSILFLPVVEYTGFQYEDTTTLEVVTGYSGVFDGAGYAICNFTISQLDDYGNSYCGIFGKINNTGVVKNLEVNDVEITAGYNYAGTICGENNGLIDNCIVDGTVTYGTAIGGICGINKGMVTKSSFFGLAQALNDAGGIAGINYGQIDQCCVKANVRAKSYAGGIAGINGDYESSIEAYITNSYAIGSVYSQRNALYFDRFGYYYGENTSSRSGYNHYAGGITALNAAGKVEYCYCSTNDLKVTATYAIERYRDATDLELDGITIASFARNLTNNTQAQMFVAENWFNAGWENGDVWLITDNSYPVLVNTFVVDKWDNVDILSLLPGEDAIHKYSLEVEQGAKAFSYGHSTTLAVKLLDDGVEVTDDYSVTWDRNRFSSNIQWLDQCYSIENGLIYNTNTTGYDQSLSLYPKVTLGNLTLTDRCDFTLLSKKKTSTGSIKKAVIKASRNRNIPNDSLLLTMDSRFFPTLVAEDIEHDSTITVEIYEQYNSNFTPIVRVFDLDETIELDWSGYNVIKKVKKIKNKSNYLDLNIGRGNSLFYLKNLDLTGLTESISVRISNSHFATEAQAVDMYLPGDSKSILAADINGSRSIPICLTKNVANHVNALKVKCRASTSKVITTDDYSYTSPKRNGAIIISGQFSLAQQNDLLNNGFAVSWGGGGELRVNSDIARYRDSGLRSSYGDVNESDAPYITEVKSGVYFVKYSCGLPGEKQTIVKGVFNTRSQRFILKVYNIKTYMTSARGVSFEIAPFEPGSIWGVFDDFIP